MSRYLLILVACGILASCETPRQHVPDPSIVVQESKIPIRAPCKPQLDPEPLYPDTDEAIAAAPDIFEVAKLYRAGRALRLGYVAQVQAALKGCAE